MVSSACRPHAKPILQHVHYVIQRLSSGDERRNDAGADSPLGRASEEHSVWACSAAMASIVIEIRKGEGCDFTGQSVPPGCLRSTPRGAPEKSNQRAGSGASSVRARVTGEQGPTYRSPSRHTLPLGRTCAMSNPTHCVVCSSQLAKTLRSIPTRQRRGVFKPGTTMTAWQRSSDLDVAVYTRLPSPASQR